ncbi:FtsX-like permease family protein [Nonomuraea sp. GTA35]|uniref:FtsX-like permease family protein n=1 Tax=Nonomuraea sp. GTA35 TaxID=1676746 RepID=UPI0035C05420
MIPGDARTMLWLARRTLRWHKGTAIGSIAAIVVAATLLSAFIVMLDSVGRQSPPVERYGAVSLVVHGRDRGAIAPETAERVSAVKGVARAVEELSFPVIVRGADGAPAVPPGDEKSHAWGHGWSSSSVTPFTVRDGRAPAAAGEVALDSRLAAFAGLAAGDFARITVNSVARAYTIVGVVQAVRPVRHQSAVFWSDEQAAALADQGGNVDAVAVLAERGTAPDALAREVAKTAPGLRVSTGPALAFADGNLFDDATVTQAMWFTVVLIGLIAVGVAGGAMGLAVRRRHREIAVLRALGMTPRGVRGMLLAEGLVLALLAAVPGIPLGVLLASLISDRLHGFFKFSASFEVVVTPWGVVWALAVLVLTAETAALLAVRAALRIRAGDALSEAVNAERPLSRARRITGIVCLLLAVPLTAAWAGGLLPESASLLGTMGTLALLVAGAGALGPSAVVAFARWPGSLVGRWWNVGGFLAKANVAFGHRRFAGVMGPLALGMTLAVSGVGQQAYFNWKSASDAAAPASVDHVIDPAYQGMRLSGDLHVELSRTPGVEQVIGLRAMPDVTVSRSGVSRTTPVAMVTGNPAEVFPLAALKGAWPEWGERSVALSAPLAAALGADAGERVDVRVPGARQEPYRVVAVYEASPAGAPVFVATSPRAADRLYLRTSARTTTAALLAAAHRISEDGLALEVRTRQESVEHQAVVNADRNRTIIYVMGLVAVFCLLASVNGLGVGMLDRRAEFDGMRMLGVSRRQVYRMIGWEVALTIAPIVVLATLLATWGVVLFAARTPDSLSLLSSFVPWDWIVVLGGVAFVLSAAGALVAARTVLKDA